MGSFGVAEILLILLIFFLLFGASRFSALARSLGLAVRKFQSSGEEESEEEDKEEGGS